MISLSRIILLPGRWTSKTLSVYFFARRMAFPFVPSELPDQKTLHTESFPFNHRTWERDWDGHSTSFYLVSWRKPQSSLLLVAVSTISALRPLVVPTFILPARNSSSFGVWILPLLSLALTQFASMAGSSQITPSSTTPTGTSCDKATGIGPSGNIYLTSHEKRMRRVFLHVGHLLTLTAT